MNKGFRLSAAALALTLGALPFGTMAEEPPPPPEARPQEQPQPPKPRPEAPKPERRAMPRPVMHPTPHRVFRQVMPLPPMGEADRAKFAEMNEEVRDAMEEFRRDGSEANRTRLRDAVGAMVEAKLKYDVDQAEKRLEFARKQLERKAALTERYLRRMTAEPAPALDRPGKPGPRAEMRGPEAKRPDGKRRDAVRPGKPAPGAPEAGLRPDAGKRGPREAGMRPGRKGGRRGVMERCFTEPERNEMREARRKLMTAEAGSAEAKAAVTGMNAVCKRALERIEKDLVKAKENKLEAETAELEQAKKFLTMMEERTADPAKYLEAMKNRPRREGRK